MNTLIASVATAILTSIVTSLIAHRLQIAKIRAEFQKDQWASVHSRKWEIYLEFINIIKEIIEDVQLKKANEKVPSNSNNVNAFKRVNAISSKMLLIGSPHVLKEYGMYRYYCANSQTIESNGEDNLMYFAKLVMAMRSDLGVESTNIEIDGILRCLMPDKDERHNKTLKISPVS